MRAVPQRKWGCTRRAGRGQGCFVRLARGSTRGVFEGGDPGDQYPCPPSPACVDSGGDFTSRLLRPAAAAVTTSAVEVSHALHNPNPIRMVVVRANYHDAPRRSTPASDVVRETRCGAHSSLPRRVPRRNFKYLRRNVTVGYQHCMCVLPMQCNVCALFVFRPLRALALRALF